MPFGLPAVLWLLPLALLPLLALRRPPAKRLSVATIQLWTRAAARDAAPLARRVRRHWLAVLQAGIVAITVMAAARPLWPWRAGAAAVVVDTSLSMSARSGAANRLALAVARATAWTSELPRGTRVRLISASPSPRLVGEFPARGGELSRALAALRPSDAGAAIDAAVALARAASPAPERVLVVTDGAAPSDPGGAEWSTVGTPADNLALVTLTARRPRPDSDSADVLAHVWNFSSREASTTLTLSRDDDVIVREALTLPPRAGRTVTAVLRGAAGIVTGRIDADDAIADDNVRATVVAPPRAVHVALHGAGGFLAQALRTRRGVVIVPDTAAGADVSVCGGCAPAVIETIAPAAGVLLTAPPDAAPAPVAPLSIEPSGPIRFAASAIEGVEAVAVEGPEAASGTVVARAGRRPAILAYESGGRRVVELRLDLSRSPLVLTPAFPILVADALDWLAGRDLERATFDAGAPVVRPLTNGAGGDARVVGPGRVAVDAAIDGRRLTVAPLASAGVYEVQQNGQADRFVVNPVTGSESDVAGAPATAAPAGVPAAIPTSDAATARPADVSLYVLLVALALVAVEWRLRPGSWRSIRGVSVTLLVLAMVAPRMPWGDASRAIVFALDASDSMSGRDGEARRAVARATAGMRRGDAAGLIVFGADAAVERPLDDAPLGGTAPLARTLGTATNLEHAIRAARALLPAGRDGRVVLVSDGHETAGDATVEALAAKSAGVPVDVVAPGGGTVRVQPASVVRRMAPPTVQQGEPFEIVATIEGAPGATPTVAFEAAGTVLARRPIAIPASGAATAALTVRGAQPGLSVYRAAVDLPDTIADIADEGAGTVVAVAGEPRLLDVSDAPAPAIAPAGYRVDTRKPADLPRAAGGLAPFDAIVLDDVDASRLDAAQRRALAQHVEQGGGLFVLGSPRSLLPLDDADPLEAALPVDLRPRRGGRAPGLALVIVFDKSGSMDDRIDGAPKIEFARQAVQRVLASLPPTDAVGVLAFDAAPVEVAALRPGHEAAALAERLGSVRPSGATALGPAIERAATWLQAPAAAGYARRLILLVSDGRTSAADQARARAALPAGIELSAVALGDEADRAFLGELARAGSGRAFYPRRLGELPSLAAREAVRVSGGRVVEERFTVQPGAHPLLAGIDTAAMPALDGYVVSVPKPGAEVALRSPLGDPVLAAWRQGLGKVAVYTADLHSTWSAGLRSWSQGPALLAQATRWVSRRVDHPFLHLETSDHDGALRVRLDARSGDGTFLSGLDVHATGRTPAGGAIDLALAPAAPGAYEGSVPLADPGPYTFSITATSADGRLDARLQRGVFWTAPRERPGDVDRARLATIARLSGGRELAAGDDPFDGPRPLDRRDTRPLLGVAAAIAFLAHVLAPRLARRTAAPAAAVHTLHKDAA